MAVSGVGTQLRRWNASASPVAAFESIAEINNITGPTLTKDFIETTALDTIGGYRTFIAGFKDAGTLSFDINFTRTVFEQMLTDYEASSAVNYELVLPDEDNTTIEFSGFVTEVPLSIQPDDKVTASITIKITGAPSINSGSGPSPG